MRFKDLYKVVDKRYLLVVDETGKIIAHLSLNDDTEHRMAERSRAKEIAESDEYIVSEVMLIDGNRPFISVEIKKDSSKAEKSC